MISLALGLLAYIALHLAAMALAAQLAGVTLREISFGLGPRWFGHGLVSFRVLPLGGYVKMKNADVEDLGSDDFRGSYDHQPAAGQVLTCLAGPAALLALALATLGVQVAAAFVATPMQMVRGAIGPLFTARTYLEGFAAFLEHRSVFAVVGLVAAKLAAVNLLPLPALNGG